MQKKNFKYNIYRKISKKKMRKLEAIFIQRQVLATPYLNVIANECWYTQNGENGSGFIENDAFSFLHLNLVAGLLYDCAGVRSIVFYKIFLVYLSCCMIVNIIISKSCWNIMPIILKRRVF